MTIIQLLQPRFSAALLLLSLAIATHAAAQDNTASTGPAADNLMSTDSGQVLPQQSGADVPPQTGPKQLSNYVEGGGDYLHLSNGFGHWTGGYARAVVSSGKNIWNAEVNGQ